MKKLLVFIVVGLLVGCGGGEEGDGSSSSSGPSYSSSSSSSTSSSSTSSSSSSGLPGNVAAGRTVVKNSCVGCHADSEEDGTFTGIFAFDVNLFTYHTMPKYQGKGYTGSSQSDLTKFIAVEMLNCGGNCAQNAAAYLWSLRKNLTPKFAIYACGTSTGPVCAAVFSPQPCTVAPCPALQYQTFDNACDATAAKVRQVIRTGECGDVEGKRVTDIVFAPCPPVAEPPQCAKQVKHSVCATEPCPTHTYETYPIGFCASHDALGSVVFDGECGALNGKQVSGEPPVKLLETLATTEKTVRVDGMSFYGDILTLNLGYSGCDQQHFELQIADSFLEPNPARVQYVFKPVLEDNCDAALYTTFSYDLTPLKYRYQKMYGTQKGEILLPGIGIYQF